jgi:hypothetical protein
VAHHVSPALKALVTRLIDYAGMFPPAALTRDVVIEKFSAYRQGEQAWMLRSLVVSAKDLENLPQTLNGSLAVLSETDEPRAATIESKTIVRASRPAYCEVPRQDLDRVKEAGCFAKIRTGGLQPEAIPSVDDVAAFISACAERRLAFKATAGLHHAIRGEQPLTYETDSARATMHGFLNVFMAAAFAWNGEKNISPILAETDPQAFAFDDKAHWRDKSLDVQQVTAARMDFAHSAGSCSFEEPVQELQALGLL